MNDRARPQRATGSARFDALYREHYRSIHSYCRRRTHPQRHEYRWDLHHDHQRHDDRTDCHGESGAETGAGRLDYLASTHPGRPL